MVTLVLPSVEYRESFLEALEELRVDDQKQQIGESVLKQYDESASFDEFVYRLRACAEGKFLPEGYVPHTFYWLVEGKTFIGGVDIRHTLTEHLRTFGGHIGYIIRPSKRKKGYGTKILKFALQKAKELGITKVRITCDEDNLASRKIIEKNGGVVDNAVRNPGGVLKRRYWINVA